MNLIKEEEMLNHINNYASQALKYNFKSEPQKKFDPQRIYYIGDKKKRLKRYVIAGSIAAVSLPLFYNLELKNKPATQSMKTFNRWFMLLSGAYLLPVLAFVFFQERANYLHNKNIKPQNDTFTKKS